MRTVFLLLITMAVGNTAATAEESAEQQVREALHAYHLAEIQGDLDGILNAYAEDFMDPQGATKPMLSEFFQALVAQGLLYELEVDMSAIVIEVDGDRASAGPVSYTTALGSNTYSYHLRKDTDGSWRFVSSLVLE